MNDEIFHLNVLIKVLRTWEGTFADENMLRIILERFQPGQITSASKWHLTLTNMIEEWRADQTDPSFFVPYAKFLSKEDIARIVIEPILAVEPSVEHMPISTTTETLASLLDLPEAEKRMLQLSMEMKNLAYPYDYIYSRYATCFDRREMMFATILGVPVEDAKAAMNGFLVRSGFIVPSSYPENFFILSEVFEESFDDRNIGIDRIEDVIFPNSLTSELSLDDYPHMKGEITRTANILARSLETNSAGTNILLWGEAGTGKTQLAIAIAEARGWKIKSVGDISPADNEEKSRAQRLSNLKIALKLYENDTNTVLLFDEIEDLFKIDNNASFSKAFINRIIETTTVPIIWTTNDLYTLGSPVLRRMTYNINCSTPPLEARRAMWDKYATQFGVNLDDSTKTMLDSFDISPALIRNTMRVTGSAIGGGVTNQEEVKEIVTSLDRLVHYGERRRFETAQAADPLYDASCVNTDHDLDRFTDQLLNANGTDFSLCLYGASGTGKSRYARHLAAKMGKPVLMKRASDLQSMWVGECEKNIAKAFEQARMEKKMLVIDEGDSFLRNRERAKNSWEVSQVNEMLSQMENHPEPFVLTTNLMDDLDPASLRRFTFKLKFDYMTPVQAARLFERYFKVKAPAALLRNHILAPGDFANVLKQVNILGLRDADAIYAVLLKECAAKPNYSREIGFGSH